MGPTTFTQVQGDGSDLYVPENISELGALSGMYINLASEEDHDDGDDDDDGDDSDDDDDGYDGDDDDDGSGDN